MNVCFSEMKVTVVCPATEKHVKKYQRQESYLVEETANDYHSITLPYIESQSFSLQVSLDQHLNFTKDYSFKLIIIFFFNQKVGLQHSGKEGRGRQDYL